MKLLSVCCCLLIGATAQAVTPDEAALAHLSALRKSTKGWKERTALFPGTTQEKQSIIQRELETLSGVLKEGELQVINSKTAGELAAVMVSHAVEYDPSQLQIHAVALLKTDDKWKPAPVPGSFANTGLRYQPDLAGKARDLETWILSEQNQQEIRLKRQLLADLLKEIRASATPEELSKTSPAAILTGFITACQTLNTPLALAFLGGLENPLPEDWRNTVSLTSRALHTPWLGTGQWRNLTDSNTLAVELETEIEGRHASVTLGLFNPAHSHPSTNEWTVRYFSLERKPDGPWRINLPLWLIEEGEEFSDALIKDEVYAQFPKRLIASTPAGDHPSPLLLVEEFLKGLRADQFSPLLSHLSRSIDADASSDLLGETSRLWRNFKPGHRRPIRLSMESDGEHAWCVYGGFDIKRPEIPSTSLLHLQMKRHDNGWLVTSAKSPGKVEDFPAELVEWARQTNERNEDEWLLELGLDQRLGGLAAAAAPDEDDARRAAETWTTALKSLEPRKIFSSITGFDDEHTTRQIYSFLGQELSTPSNYEILGIHRHGRWAGATIRHRNLDGNGFEHLMLHPIVVTPGGPRVMPEAILYNATNRAQRYLNESVWKRLRGRLPEPTVAEFETLYEAHEKLCNSINKNE